MQTTRTTSTHAGARRTTVAAIVGAAVVALGLAGASPATAATVDPIPAQLTVSLGGCASAGAVTSASAEVDETRTIAVCATVQNAAGGALPLVPVTVKVDRGFATGSATPTSTPTMTSTVTPTDTDGHATEYVGSTTAGKQTATVTAGSLTKTATITYYSSKTAKVTVSPMTATIAPGESKALTATLTDRFGNPVYNPDHPAYSDVLFSQTGPAVTSPGSSSVERSAGTDGTASFGIDVPVGSAVGATGTSTVTPLAYSTTTAPSAALTYTVGASKVAKVVLSGLQPVVVRNVETLRATVTDSTGAPVGDTGIRFDATLAGTTVSFSTTTNSGGVATFAYRTPHAGELTVTALAGSSVTDRGTAAVSAQPVTFKVGAYSPAKGRIVLVALPSPRSQVVIDSTVDFYYKKASGFSGPIPVEVDDTGRAQVTISRASGYTYSFYATIDHNPDVVASLSDTVSVRAK